MAVKLDRCVESCNTFNDLSNKLGVPNKKENLNLSEFNIITEMNELKTLTKDISCKCILLEPFMIIIQVLVLIQIQVQILFFLPKKIFLETNTLWISTSFK